MLHSFLYKNNFIRTKALVLEKNCLAEHKNKVSRLAVSKMIMTEYQNRAWLSLILYCM